MDERKIRVFNETILSKIKENPYYIGKDSCFQIWFDVDKYQFFNDPKIYCWFLLVQFYIKHRLDFITSTNGLEVTPDYSWDDFKIDLRRGLSEQDTYDFKLKHPLKGMPNVLYNDPIDIKLGFTLEVSSWNDDLYTKLTVDDQKRDIYFDLWSLCIKCGYEYTVEFFDKLTYEQCIEAGEVVYNKFMECIHQLSNEFKQKVEPKIPALVDNAEKYIKKYISTWNSEEEFDLFEGLSQKELFDKVYYE